MIEKLNHIAKLTSGIYTQPGISPNVLYLQAVDYSEFGELSPIVKPKLQFNKQIEPHLLREGDVLFAAKGMNNFAVVYYENQGKAVASSSFIVIRLSHERKQIVSPEYLAWFLTNSPEIFNFHKQQLGTTIPSISIKLLKELDVSIPTLEKQNLIVKIQDLRDREVKITSQLNLTKDKYLKKLILNALK